MATHYRTQGFIVKKTDRGETDQLLTIYTKDFGKLEILGKAIRKVKSKLRGGAELFYFSEIEFIQGKTNKTLTDANLIESFPNIRKNLKKLAIAHKIAEECMKEFDFKEILVRVRKLKPPIEGILDYVEAEIVRKKK